MDATTRNLPVCSCAVMVMFAAMALSGICVNVQAATPPSFTSTPSVNAYLNQEYSYMVTVVDADDDAVSLHAAVRQADQSNTLGAPAVLREPVSGWQSFTADKTGFLKAVRLKQYSNSVNRVLRIYAGTGTAGTLLYSQAFPGAGENEAWRLFEFDTAVAVSAGQTYTLQFDGQGQSVEIFFDIGGDHYAGGCSDISPTLDYLFETIVLVPSPDGLPAWLGLNDKGDGTGELSGTPGIETLGNTYDILLLAADSTLATVQSFAVTVNKVPYVTAISRVDPDPTNAAALHYTVVFSEPVTGVDTADFSVVTSGTASAGIADVNGQDSLYTVTLNGVAGNGTLQLKLIDDDSIQSVAMIPLGGPGAGNGDFTGAAYQIDTIAPAVSMSPVSSPRNTPAGVVSISFSEDVSGVDIADFRLTCNGAEVAIPASALSPVSAGRYALDLAGVTAGDGEYALSLVAAGSGIADAAGNALAGDAVVSWRTDTTAPVAGLSPVSSPRNTPAGVVGISFSEDVSGVDITDFRLTCNGAEVVIPASALSPVSAGRYALDLAGVTAGAGEYALSLVAAGSGIADAAGNALAGDAVVSWRTDTTAPVAGLSPVSSPRNTPAGVVSISFSEDVSGVDIADFRLTCNGAEIVIAPAALSTVSADTYTLDLSGVASSEGEYMLTLVSTGSGIMDSAGNTVIGDAEIAWIMDTTVPQVTDMKRIDDGSDFTSAAVALTFSENVSGLEVQDLMLTRNGQPTADMEINVVPVDEKAYTIELSGLDPAGGAYELTLVADNSGIADAAGNLLEQAASVQWEWDNGSIPAPPQVVAVTRKDRNPTRRKTVRYKVTFSKEVFGVDRTDFELTCKGRVRAGVLWVRQVSRTEFLVRVGRIRGHGKLRLDVMDDDSIIDLDGTPLGGMGSGNGDFLEGQWYRIKSSCWWWNPRSLRAWLQMLIRKIVRMVRLHVNLAVTAGTKCSRRPFAVPSKSRARLSKRPKSRKIVRKPGHYRQHAGSASGRRTRQR